MIAQALGIDMADWWHPTAGTFLNHLSRAKAVETLTEATGFDALKEVGGMKKAATAM